MKHTINLDEWNKQTDVDGQTSMFDAHIEAIYGEHAASRGRSMTAIEGRAQRLEALVIVLANRIAELEAKGGK